MKPFAIEPLPVVRVWGGTRLAELGRCPAGPEPIGESWEVHGSQKVRGGDQSLDELCRIQGAELLGEWGGDPEAGFPLLTKWLDCRQWLSVQVHPDDRVALRLAGPGQRGKAEAWLFVEVAADAEVIHGFAAGRPGPEVLRHVSGAEWLSLVRRYRPEPYSWVYTPPGTVHALGPGLLVFEVQQSSDLTYRMYDWDRLGLDGQPRQMHESESRQAIADSLPEPAVAAPDDLLGELAVSCPHFLVESLKGEREWSPAGRSVELLTALSAPATVECGGDRWTVAAYDTLVVPATAPALRWSGSGPWLRVRLAPPQSQ